MADGNVPQFPGKGGVAEPGKPGPTQQRPGWQNAICPILTAGEIARKQDNLVVTAGAQPKAPKAQACVGPQCMMFIEMKLADGSMRSGCAPVQAVGQLIGLNMMVSEFMIAAKRGAEAEAAAQAAAAGETPAVPVDSPPPSKPE